MALPDIFSYRDHRVFLSDWLTAKRRLEPGYSLAVFARDGGCSKGAIANVLSGARMPRPATVEAFARAMGLSAAEHGFLGLLVELADAPTLDRRRAVMARILATERYEQVRLADRESDEDLARFLEHWYVPAIWEMAGLEGFRADPEWIAARLFPPVAVTDVARALDTLFDLDFLRRADDGRTERRGIRFTTGPEAAGRAVTRYHRQEIPVLLQHLDPSRHQQQHLMAMTLAIDPDQMDEMKSHVTALFDRLGDLADAGGAARPRRAYQLAVQLVPLTVAEGDEPASQ